MNTNALTSTGTKTSPAPRHWWLWPVSVFLLSRLFLFFVLAIAVTWLPFPEGAGFWRLNGVPSVADALCRWDSGWYLSIFHSGYSFNPDAQSSVAFFPLYPLLCSLTSHVAWNGWDSVALTFELVSNVCFLGGLLIAYRLALAMTDSENVARLTVLLLAFQPATLFFSAPYTESLFLLLSAATLLAAFSRKWALAGVLGMLCSATRNLGVFLAPAIGLMWFAANGIDWRALIDVKSAREALRILLERRSWLWVLLVPCGLLAYMLYLHLQFGDAFAFVTVQKQWGHAIAGFWQVIPRKVVSMLVGGETWNVVVDTSSFLVFALLGVVVWIRFGSGMGVFCLACILIPASATTMSMMRYVAVIVPSFVVLADFLEKRKLAGLVLGPTALLAGVFAVLYSHWVFVA